MTSLLLLLPGTVLWALSGLPRPVLALLAAGQVITDAVLVLWALHAVLRQLRGPGRPRRMEL